MKRSFAAVLDGLLALLLTSLLAPTVGHFFAERAVVTFDIYSPDSWWNGPIPLVLGAVSTLSYGVAFAVTAILLPEGLWGQSPGKRVWRLQVRLPSRGHRKPRRWVRFLLKTSPWWVFWVGLLAGRWPIVALAALLGVWSLLDLIAAPLHGRGLWYDRLLDTRVGPLSVLQDSHTAK